MSEKLKENLLPAITNSYAPVEEQYTECVYKQNFVSIHFLIAQVNTERKS